MQDRHFTFTALTRQQSELGW